VATEKQEPQEAEELEDLPGFAPTTSDPLIGDEDGDASLSTPASPGPETTSIPPSHPDEEQRGRSRSHRSSTTSTDNVFSHALPELGVQLALALGALLNKLARRRRPSTELWLMTEEEARGIGGSLGRIAARKAPEDLVSEEASDVVELAGATLGYGIRNTLGVSASDMAAAADVVEATARERAPEPPPERPGPPPAPGPAAAGSAGVAPAEPGPAVAMPTVL
jgi:hypothetical protein